MPRYLNHRTNRKQYRLMSDINVTPMVDVMLVLLVIFMVTAPLLTSGIPVNLPKGDGQVLQGADKALDISISKKGTVFIADKEYTKDKLLPKIKATTSLNSEMQIVISADTEAEYGDVIEVMGILKQGGYNKIGLKTELGSAAKTRTSLNKKSKDKGKDKDKK